MENNFFISGKSAVNFCELDLFIYDIGEIWNVLSSFVIVFFGLYGLYGLYNYNYNYNTKDNKSINLIKTESNILYSLLTLIGLGSVFFHHKLSPFAHWIDIIFISMILVYTQYILSLNPNSYIFMQKIKYSILMFIHFIVSIYIPQFHIFFLFVTGFIIKNLIEYKINSSIYLYDYNKVVQNYWWIKKYFIIALVFWIFDYLGCIFITPYHVHWIFHIFIGLTSYKIIDLIKYL